MLLTKINAGDCVAAQEMVKCLLSGLPLAPVSIPVIARLLTEGEEEIEGGKHRAKTYYPHISMEMAAESIRRGGNGFEGEENGDSSDGRMETGGNSLLGIFYAEDEELCFRAVVGESGFTVYRQNDFGFEQIYSVEFPCGISAQEKQCAAREFHAYSRGRVHPVLMQKESAAPSPPPSSPQGKLYSQGLEQDVLTPAKTPWQHTVFPVPKSNVIVCCTLGKMIRRIKRIMCFTAP